MKIFTGIVISKKMQKTATVSVERVGINRLYKKRIKSTKKYHVHDELGSNVGQTVRFSASRPYSKTKRWKIIEVVTGDPNVRQKARKSKVGDTKKKA